MIERIGFVGLGNMGAPMAARLLGRGFDVTVFDIRSEAVAPFVEHHGGRAAGSLADAGRDVEAVITMLPDGKAVRSALLGPDGVASTLSAGAIAIDMGTSHPKDSVATAAGLLERHIGFVDAPVMGGVPFAKDGTLEVMAGGNDAAIDRCLPLFDALGRRVFRCGAVGAGHTLKALANYVNACTFINVLEAMAAGRKCGLSTAVMSEALVAMCAGRQHPMEKKVIPQVLSRKFATGMALGLIAKDVKIAVDLAQSAGAEFPLGERVQEIWERAAAELGATVDQSEIVRLWEAANGVELRSES